MPTQPEDHNSSPRRRRGGRRSKKPSLLSRLLPAAILLFLVALLGLVLTRCAVRQADGGDAATPPPTLSATPDPLPTPTPAPTPSETVPTPTPTPTPLPVYDFTQPVPERDAVGEDYFADAVFIGDSRTDGLKLYSGIKNADFIEHTGITVFEVATKKVIRIDGNKYTVLEALGLKQYQKVYLMLGVNELGYFDDESFQKEYAGFVDKIRELQPDAVIYLQNLPVINADKAKANDQPYYVTNEQIAVYNGIIAGIAADKHTAFVDVNSALVDENGILPREGTTDGIHFSKDYYVKWYDYLKVHTVDEAQYWAEKR